MSKIDNDVIAAFEATRHEVLEGSESTEPGDPSTVAAVLVLASEVRGAREELKRIAEVLGADAMASSKIAQSDTPDTMLSLLTALKATQT